ncbi:hypothetical protein C0J45_7503 [Silurus meridionalis]|nr:hypothetical protein C0J45_7503 [Silurus meridionalis]
MKLKRLDAILASKLFNEKEVKKQGRELHQKLWKEFKADVSMCFVSGTPGEGYTPDAAELEKLLQIDAKLQLLPVRGFLSVQSSYGYCFSQDKNAGELGERVLQDMKELREQKVVLCEIQQQLQLHTERQHPYEVRSFRSGRRSGAFPPRSDASGSVGRLALGVRVFLPHG